MAKEEQSMGLLPIMSPLYNLREICKQMSLLEDHLNNVRKRCPDCIRKHFLTIEALFEEAVSLDKDFEYDEVLDGKAQDIRNLQGEWIDCRETKDSHSEHLRIAQALRAVRKEFAPLCFDVRKMATIVRKASSSSCPHARRNMIRRIATRSNTELEDQQVEKQVRQSPKKKPPRKDLMNRRMPVEDKDLHGLDRGRNGDRDLRTDFK